MDFKKFPVVSYGIENDCDFRARDIESLGLDGTKFSVDIYGREHRIYIKTPGVHNVYNALAAIACGVHYSVSPDRIKEGIENFTMTKMRMSVEKKGDLTVINDCYNSSPDSLRAALKVLSTQNTRRVAILGDILEMGDYAKNAHYELGKSVAENGVDILLTAGENAKYMVQGAKDSGFLPENTASFDTTEDLVKNVGDYIKDNDSILIKASRGMHFEKIVEKITQEN